MEETNTPQNGTVRWTNRRRMAWTSLIAMIVVTLLCLFVVSESRLTILAEVLTWFYFCMVSIIGSYMGMTTWASIKGIRENR
jgi:hypothetical protein